LAEELFPFDPPLTDDFPVETELRKLLTGHKGGNAEHSQGVSYELVAPALDPTSDTWCSIRLFEG